MSDEAAKRPRKPTALRLDRGERGEDGETKGPGGLAILPEPNLPAPLPASPIPSKPARRGLWLRLALSGLGGLLSLGVSLWVADLVARLNQYSPLLGGLGLFFAALFAIAILVLLGREVRALSRLARVEKLRERAETAIAADDRDAARLLADDLVKLYAARPDMARARGEVATHLADIVDGADLVRLTERRLMSDLDRQAVGLVTQAAKRVSIVTAVAPRAIFDVVMVIAQSTLLVRRLATLYGARPGGLASLQLGRAVLGHLAVTGGMALGESVVEQFLGQGLAAKLSAKLGEGVVNGMMTARVGLTTLDIVRPLPFVALERPKLADILGELAQLK